MIDPHWLALVIGIVAALLLIGLLLKAALGRGPPRARGVSWRQRTVGFRRVVPRPAATEGCG